MATKKYLVTVREVTEHDFLTWVGEGESLDPEMDSSRFPHLAEFAFESEVDLFEDGTPRIGPPRAFVVVEVDGTRHQAEAIVDATMW